MPTVFPPPEFPDKLDNTILSCYDSCRHKVFREFFQHLSPVAISPDLHAGGAFAKGAEIVRLAVWRDNMPLADALLLATREFIKFWGDYEPPFSGGLSHAKTFENTLLALHDYFREFPPLTDPFQPYMIDDKPAIEFTFAIPMNVIHPISGDPILYCGRLDLLGYHNNLLCMLDDKTTKGLGATWANKWTMRGQFFGYGFACQQYEIPVQTAVIRGVAIQKTQFKYATAIINMPQWQIDRWWIEANNKARDMVECWNDYIMQDCDPEAFRHSYGDACTAYGGCVFEPLCTTHVPENWLSEYKYRKWDPLAKDPTSPDAT